MVGELEGELADPEALGNQVAQDLRRQGADAILASGVLPRALEYLDDDVIGIVADFLGEPRSTANDSKLFQMMVGTQGRVDAIDGSWDVYYSTGQTETQNELRGFGDLVRWVSRSRRAVSRRTPDAHGRAAQE